jgi:hypothetical protein
VLVTVLISAQQRVEIIAELPGFRSREAETEEMHRLSPIQDLRFSFVLSGGTSVRMAHVRIVDRHHVVGPVVAVAHLVGAARPCTSEENTVQDRPAAGVLAGHIHDVGPEIADDLTARRQSSDQRMIGSTGSIPTAIAICEAARPRDTPCRATYTTTPYPMAPTDGSTIPR